MIENVLAHLSAEITTVDLTQLLIVADNPREMKAKIARWTMSARDSLFVEMIRNAEKSAEAEQVQSRVLTTHVVAKA